MVLMFAVHLADGLLPMPWLLGGAMVSGLILLLSYGRIRDEEIPRIGLLTAALFVASQIHLPIGVGSVHMLLNAIAGILLGRTVGFALLIALAFQAVLFGHGGLTTLGLNLAVLGIPALLAATVFGLLRGTLLRFPNRAVLIGCGIGAFTSLLTVAGNGAIIWFGLENGGRESALAVMLMHIPVIVVESIGTGVVVAYLTKVKPEWLKLVSTQSSSQSLTQSSTGVTSSNGTSH